MATAKKKYATVIGFVQFDPHGDNEFDGRQVISGSNAFKFAVKAVGFEGQPNVTVTLFDQWEHAFDLIQRGALVAVDGEYKLYTKPETGKKYHNLTGYTLNVNGQPIEPAESERTVANAVAASDDDDLPF